jgi:hypothetical protein
MPFGTAKVIGFPVEKDAVGGIVKVIIAATDALISRFQQVFMLIDHAKAKVAIHCYYELWESHILFSYNRYYQLSGTTKVTVFTKIDALPSSQVQLAIGDWDSKTYTT